MKHLESSDAAVSQFLIRYHGSLAGAVAVRFTTLLAARRYGK
ncbi:hypothetical protein OIU92_28850 [Escherichia coli]|nr:hypothetical protein [Escherichia coli]